MRYVPAECTSELQPLDLSGNKEKEFCNWYVWQVQSELESGKSLVAIQIDLKLSTLNPVHAGRLVSAFDSIKSETIKLGWHLRSVEAIDFLTVYKLCIFV